MARSKKSAPPARWKKLGTRPLAETRVFTLNAERWRHPGRGTEREFAVLDAPDWVNVLALTPEGALVLVRQFRFGTGDFSLEIPGGMVDRGEKPLVAGGRELLEETGFAGARARVLGTVSGNPAILNNRCHFVLVEDAVRTAATAWDHDEEIEIVTAPVAKVLAWARAGRIVHPLVLNALFLFEPRWAEIQRRPSRRRKA